MSQRDWIAEAREKYTPYPEEYARRYREEGLWIGRRLDRLAAGEPQATALIDARETLTYAELEAEVAGIAAVLRQRGIASRQPVLLHLPNTVEVVLCSLALMRCGALPVYLLDSHRSADVVSIKERAQATAYLSTRQRVAEEQGNFEFCLDAAEIREAARGLASGAEVIEAEVEVDPGEVAFLQLSGGTTGVPKLIPRTHDDYLYSVLRSNEVCGITAETRMLVVLPATHNYPTSSPGYLGVLAAGGVVILSEHSAPEHAFGVVEKHRPTTVALVPPLARTWSAAAPQTTADLSSLRVVQVGGAKLVPQAARELIDAADWHVQQVFGMAEGLVCYTSADDSEEHIVGTQGRPMSAFDEVRIVGPDGQPVPEGTSGVLQVRGPYTIRGYWDAPEHNARSFTPDGFYITGDVVRRLPSGHLVVEGRDKDQINRGGEKISAEEVEDHILAHPAVFDAAVIGQPDAYLGERACAVVVLREGQALRRPDLSKFLRERGLARYKIPDTLRIVSAFPTTKVGKLSRAELRQLLASTLNSTTDTQR
ncbi:(2,3-dihydroxybenzoyl)adenylate synthase [Corynebacterium lowii]|uniref:2,3-dihydroxybenzoate-AMP ligase n=1 Tax=Corynebacterium lowii TaxID=1544413 RepID=A0A0Q0YQT9_9CORY|nr:AMP-binding protein [Corynebacterium lowii]KQB84799.1 2,3-dihydroxybenzoate-AMP ligase [Corynebacterium lowii]MDP9851703.1 2,3-dihydroxybenzoate-AMP ligase [Corynebacterium lowii]